MFRRRTRESTKNRPLPRVPLDPFLGSRPAHTCFDLAVAGRFDSATQMYREAEDLSHREQIVFALADDHTMEPVLATWCDTVEDDALAITAWCGCRANRVAGVAARNAKTGQDAAWVPELVDIEARLHRAVRLDPGATAPWQWLLRTGRLLSVNVYELRLRFDQSVRTGGPTLATALQMLVAASAWRGVGSHETMHSIADDMARGAAPGSTLHVLPVVAQLIRATEPDADWRTHVLAAAAAADEAEKMSVGHPSFDLTTPDAAIALNVLCCAAARAGRHDQAQRHRDIIGGRVHRLPWRWFGEPEVAYLRKWRGP